MKVRGAPAIGASAAFAVVLEAKALAAAQPEEWQRALQAVLPTLQDARPTAVNLAWAVARMKTVVDKPHSSPQALISALTAEAEAIAALDVQTNRAIGHHGALLFPQPVRLLTHCNTGSLATVEYGTALGVIRSLHSAGRLMQVWVDETRPYLQGARLTAYELQADGIPHTLITDSMAGHFMKQGLVDGVVVGADRIARNGDAANKIGTYSLAVLAAYHNIPFYIAAPISTFDASTLSGEDIPIEERSADEVLSWNGQRLAPLGTTAAHPAFDVTPHALITGLITERGVLTAPYTETIRDLHASVK